MREILHIPKNTVKLSNDGVNRTQKGGGKIGYRFWSSVAVAFLRRLRRALERTHPIQAGRMKGEKPLQQGAPQKKNNNNRKSS